MTKLKILLILFFPVLVYCQTAKEMLTEMQAKYKSVKSFSADFMQQTRSELQKGEYKSSGKVFFKKSNKIRIEMKDQLLISDGKTIWNNNTKQNKVIITNSDSEPSMLSLDKFILEFPQECDASFSGSSDGKIIQLKPKKKNSGFKDIKIYPDKSTILSKVEFTDSNGNYFSFEFSNVKLDENLSDKQFSFTVPKGTRTVDLR